MPKSLLWSPADNRKLIHYWRTGMPISYIAQQFPDRTTNAVEQHGRKTLQLPPLKSHRKRACPLAWSRIEGSLRDHGPQTSAELAKRLHIAQRHVQEVLSLYQGIACRVVGVRMQARNRPLVWDIGVEEKEAA
ncbi:hypothetical protein [Cupriavidus sp. AcVe19-6a]|uniref:hypothetical protein n=1 Tax=Cupriavidus sp. AcVe19-6a TaxID=2821358 RepID=UPI001AE6D5DA|nr:hypothetical protein [Cupriavidus sp. AcVe19-6a]MBP0634924.1 hypothetical protein [Cupriavidus sp. AcVe19-6a]